MSVCIIAEAGVNHNGNMSLAKQLVDMAASAGADYVKFQSFKADKLTTNSAPKAEYQVMNTSQMESQLEMLRRLELSHDVHLELISHCKTRNIKFLSTAFDVDGLNYLFGLEVDLIKIPSGEITNLPYLRVVGALKLPVLLSTGMCDLGDIESAINVLLCAGLSRDDITLLHCNTEYPTPMSDVNLRAMISMNYAFGTKVGYSDHTLGIEVPVAAVALGAQVIEKHFTLDRKLPGPDHRASLEPNELVAMISAIRNVEIAMGDGIKRPSKSELKNMVIARKSIVAAKAINKGDVFCSDNITAKRPATGLSPMFWDELIGMKASRDFKVDEQIKLS